MFIYTQLSSRGCEAENENISIASGWFYAWDETLFIFNLPIVVAVAWQQEPELLDIFSFFTLVIIIVVIIIISLRLVFIHFSIEFTSPSCRPHFPPRWRDDAWNCVKISLSRSHSASTIVLLSPPSSHFFAESRRGRNSTRLIFWNNLVCPPVTLSFSLSLGRTFGLGRRSVSDTQSTFTITPNSSALCWGLRWGVDEMIVNSWVYHTQNLFCFFFFF